MSTSQKLLALFVLGSSFLLAGPRVFVGVGFGGPRYGYYAPPPPPPGVVFVPRHPRAGYYWVPGYWQPAGRRYNWRAGYWARPPYARARWVEPCHRGGRYYRGYWR